MGVANELPQMMICTEATSWVKHAGGAGRLMHVRGAHNHQEGFDYFMYLAFCGAIVCLEFKKQGRCIIANTRPLLIDCPSAQSQSALFLGFGSLEITIHAEQQKFNNAEIFLCL